MSSAAVWSGWWLGPCALFMIICMVWMFRMMVPGRATDGSRAVGWRPDRTDEAERVLADRLASGEIDIEEYERRLGALQHSRESDREPDRS